MRTGTDAERVYRQTKRSRVLLAVINPALMALAYLGSIYLLVFAPGNRGGSIFLGVLVLSLAASYTLLWFYGLSASPEISIGEVGVTARYLWGVKTLGWRSISEIVWKRYADPQRGIDRNKYVVSAGSSKIQFNDNISNLSGLLDDLNAYIAHYAVPLTFIDCGVVFRTRILTSNLSPSEKRRHLRQGERTTVSHL